MELPLPRRPLASPSNAKHLHNEPNGKWKLIYLGYSICHFKALNRSNWFNEPRWDRFTVKIIRKTNSFQSCTICPRWPRRLATTFRDRETDFRNRFRCNWAESTPIPVDSSSWPPSVTWWLMAHDVFWLFPSFKFHKGNTRKCQGPSNTNCSEEFLPTPSET